MAWRARLLVLAAGLVASGAFPAAQGITKREAALVDQKVTAVSVRGASLKPGKASRPVRTQFTERELNVYLESGGKTLLPAGVRDPHITIAGDQRVIARATVDLDAVRKSKERSWLDPFAYLSGAVEVTTTGLLQTANGKGTFAIESATIGSLPVPKSLVQELVGFYSRTPETPGGMSLDKPFDLPANIREVQIQRGAATVIQ